MPAYRIKHIPSGLFYIPSRNILVGREKDFNGPSYRRRVKSNLSKTGKLYLRRPSLKHLGSVFYNHLLWTNEMLEVRMWNSALTSPVVESEWVIEEVK